MADDAGQIVASDPAHPLRSISHSPTEADLKRETQPCERAPGTEHDARTQEHDAHPRVRRRFGRALPIERDAREEIVPGCAGFSERVISAMRAVEPGRRAAQERAWLFLEIGDG